MRKSKTSTCTLFRLVTNKYVVAVLQSSWHNILNSQRRRKNVNLWEDINSNAYNGGKKVSEWQGDRQKELQCYPSLSSTCSSDYAPAPVEWRWPLSLLSCRNMVLMMTGFPILKGKSAIWIFIINLPIFKCWQYIQMFFKNIVQIKQNMLKISTSKTLLKTMVYFG